MSLRNSNTRTSIRLLPSKPKRTVKRKQFYDELYDDDNNHLDKNSPKKIKLDSKATSIHKKPITNVKQEKNRSSSTSIQKASVLSDKNNSKKGEKNLTKKRISRFRDRLKNAKSKKLSSVPDMDPTYFLRCHSESNDASDDGNLVWMCRFQPRPLWTKKDEHEGTGTNLMASCGGKIVCIIDYTNGKVMMRYKDINKDENFYAMAWTTLEVTNKVTDKKAEQKTDSYFTNILAVAGECQEIKLLHPSQLVVYAGMIGHKKAISCLLFHSQNPTWLFSGSEDRRIILWDIGMPDFTDYSMKHSQLVVLECDEGILNLVYSSSLGWLLAGTEDGCFGWKMNESKVVGKSRRPAAQFRLPQLNSDEECVDGLVLIDDNIVACKYVEESFIYIWNLKECVPSQVGQSKTPICCVDPFALLKYINIDDPYVYLSGTKNRLVVGDSEGRIYIYNIKNLRKNVSDFLYIPSRILDWPEIEYPGPEEAERPIINTVIINEAATHIVATTDNNIICVWKCQDS